MGRVTRPCTKVSEILLNNQILGVVNMSAEVLKLDVDGMTCAACVASVEKIIEKSQHVKAVAVNLPLGSANIQLHQSADAETIQEILSNIKTWVFRCQLTR